MQKSNRQVLFVVAGTLALAAMAGSLAFFGGEQTSVHGGGRAIDLAAIPFDGNRSYEYLKNICAIGPRPSGSAGMQKQQELLSEHFSRLGGQVSMSEWSERHPQDGSRVDMRNLHVVWHPDRRERILLCAHYDTRPFPDEDRRRPRGVFVGANDGASGAAVLCELAHHMAGLDSRYGVDFVLFDGEEFIFDQRRDRDFYFRGSTYFAREYVRQPPDYRYRYGVLLDMVGDAQLQVFQEQNSRRHARQLVDEIWQTAADLGVSEFIPRTRHEIRDDHLPLNTIAKIPTCDIIDFDYPRLGDRAGSRSSYWHTTADTPDKCSAQSLAKVGWVVLEWLQRTQ